MRKWFVIGLCLLTLGVYAGTNEVKQMVAIFTSLGGEPEVMEESEQYVRLALGDSVTVELFKANADDDFKQYVLITACAPHCSSRVRVYSKEWEFQYSVEAPFPSIFPLATIDKKTGHITWSDNDTWDY